MEGPSSLGGGGSWARGDGFLLIIVGILLTLGLLMIYSASAVVAESRHGDAAYFVKRQVLWAVLGLGALAAGSGIDYHRWRRAIVPLTLGMLFLLVTVLVAGWAVNGSRRWIRFGGVSIQPSELARV
ncbi:MAG: FtsW/RodA/SpoVE family cell cycle protein, partial [Nitrospirae bacterium]|nr:FtsW/RodA/SpoVE family cell cycle protein [Nitrospirota bacterium]